MMELMAEIERAVDLPPAVAAHLAVHRPAPLRYPAPPPSGPAGDYPQVRLAALPLLSVPDQARLLEDPAGLPLGTLRQALRAGRARGALARRAGGQLVAFGDDARLAAALAGHGVQVTGTAVPIGPGKDDEEPDSTDIGLIAETLARALGRTRGITEVLRSGQRHLLRARDEDPRRPDDTAALAGLRAAAGGPVTGHLTGPGGARLPWAEAMTLAVDWRDGTWRLLFAPEIWVRPGFTDPPAGMSPAAAREAAARLGAEFARARLARRYNSATGQLLAAWVRLLTSGGAAGDPHGVRVRAGRGRRRGRRLHPGHQAAGVPPAAGRAAEEQHVTATAVPGPALTHIRLTEPALAFDPADAAQQHLNPLAGLAEFGPYSAAAWEAAGQQVRVAILAPHDAIDPVRGLLNSLRDSRGPAGAGRLPAPLPGLQGRVPHRAHPRRRRPRGSRCPATWTPRWPPAPSRT